MTKPSITAYTEGSDQPVHPPYLIRVFAGLNLSYSHADNEDSDQTGRMRRLICIFHGWKAAAQLWYVFIECYYCFSQKTFKDDELQLLYDNLRKLDAICELREK